MTIKAALFDMDGTIVDSQIDWLGLREEIAIPWDGRPILAQLAEVNEATRARGLAALHRVEAHGAETGELIDGAMELFGLLRESDVPCALVTNNSRDSAQKVLTRHGLRFDVVLTRDDGAVKPAPDLFLEALRRLDVEAHEALVVGDAHLDLIGAEAAGIPNTILIGTPDWMRVHIPPDMEYTSVETLREAMGHIRELLA